ncbi:MAG: RES family NAD+ phosphorylase [Paracoccaceae bacterium]
MLPQNAIHDPTIPAQAPFGRFHRKGQIAAYASLSALGARVAIQRYLSDGVSRMLVPMTLKAQRVADLRGNKAASIVWQDIVAEGGVSPTWTYSDNARHAGAQAILYSSRSRPELTHVAVFQTNCLSLIGPATPFDCDDA